MDEKRLWWELDKIAVKEYQPGGNNLKSLTAETMMKFLERPTFEECKRFYEEDNKGEKR